MIKIRSTKGLLATINGKELKYIIRKGTPEYDLLTKTGQANITDAIKQELVVRFLLSKVCSKGITLLKLYILNGYETIFFLSGFYLPLFKDGFISIYRFRKN